MSEKRFSLKDHLFNEEKVTYLGGLLSHAMPDFDRRGFEAAVMSEMLELELKQRIALIAAVLARHLHPDFEMAAAQIKEALPPPLDPSLGDDDFGDFILAPFGKFVEDNGLNHFEISMALLRDLTMRFSMEGSVRPFINLEPERTLALFAEWARDDNYHVRRLVSEGTRPRLPWSPRIDLDPARPLPLLDVLHADPTRYVTRSVANHINDISKLDPELAISTLERWREWQRQDPGELAWMTKHALRTLIKQGDRAAMGLLGFSPDPSVSATIVDITPEVLAGESLEFAVELTATDDEALLVDYAIDFVKSDGGTKPKVFKLKTLNLAAGETVTLNKRHPLRSDATTYSLYSGTHAVTVTANGRAVAEGSFELIRD